MVAKADTLGAWAVPEVACPIPPDPYPVDLPHAPEGTNVSFDRCVREVHEGPVTKWRRETPRGSICACYHWPSSTNLFRGAVVALHGYGSHTMFQYLRHAANGERHARGLWYEGSFAQQVTEKLQLHFYAMDLEGHGYSRPQHDREPLYMTAGLAGTLQDLQQLLADVREQHGLLDNARILLLGHSTGGLLALRAATALDAAKAVGSSVAGVAATSPFLDLRASDGSEALLSPGVSGYLQAIARGLWFLSRFKPSWIVANGYARAPVGSRRVEAPERALQKAVMYESLVERWVAVDRVLVPLFMAPFTPVRLNFVYSAALEVHEAQLNTHQLRTPLLVLHSVCDPLLPYESSERFVRNASSADKSLENPIGSMLHNLQLEEEGAAGVNERLALWIDAVFRGMSNVATTEQEDEMSLL
eukprot:scaffold2442_cov181-Pinguiococcus_pyrenoidosus.AAC.3